MSKEKLEHLETTGMIDRKHSKGKQREKMLDGQSGRVTDALKLIRDPDAWEVMIACASKPDS